MSTLMDRLKKAGSVDASTILSKSIFFVSKDMTKTELPVLNIAFSGDIDGGLTSGVTVLAGVSRSYKTMLAFYCMKAYLERNKEAVALFYDSEFGAPAQYIESIGIDSDRVIHVPVTNLEELKFDMTKRLEEIKRGDKVFILVDSIGNLASKKEIENALNESSAQDMTRAREIKSFFRIVTPHITMKDIPCIIVAHTYKEQSLFPKDIISGGSGIIYSANTAFIISRSQEKQGSDVVGYNFTINIEKSRFVREKSKLTFQVLWDSGINKWSGLLDIALNGGYVVKPAQGWYARVNTETNETEEKKWRLKDTYCDEFWTPLVNNENFKTYVKNNFQIGGNANEHQDTDGEE